MPKETDTQFARRIWQEQDRRITEAIARLKAERMDLYHVLSQHAEIPKPESD